MNGTMVITKTTITVFNVAVYLLQFLNFRLAPYLFLGLLIFDIIMLDVILFNRERFSEKSMENSQKNGWMKEDFQKKIAISSFFDSLSWT